MPAIAVAFGLILTLAVWKRDIQIKFGRKWPLSAFSFAVFLLLIGLRPRKFIDLFQWRNLR